MTNVDHPASSAAPARRGRSSISRLEWGAAVDRSRRVRSRLGTIGRTRWGRGAGLERFAARLEREIAVGDPEVVGRRVEQYRRFVDRVERIASPDGDGRSIERSAGVHSRQYVVDMLPMITRRLRHVEWGSSLTMLDVGCGAGHGSNLLGQLFASTSLRVQVSVTALDVRDTYHTYIGVTSPFVRHRVAALEDIEEAYDLVFCSHVVEHVRHPVAFCAELQRCARSSVFLSGPYREPPDRIARGHRRSIDDAFFESIRPRELEIIESPAWGAFHDPPYKMFVAELAGTAEEIS